MRVGIEGGGTIVWLTRREGSNAWVVTGYERNPDGRAAGRATSAPTQSAASLTRDGLGAGFDSTILDDDAEDKGVMFARRSRSTENWIDDPARLIPEGVRAAPGRAVNAAADVLPKKVGDYLRYVFDGTTAKTFNWYHKTIGSQFHKAKLDPQLTAACSTSRSSSSTMSRSASGD